MRALSSLCQRVVTGYIHLARDGLFMIAKQTGKYSVCVRLCFTQQAYRVVGPCGGWRAAGDPR